MTDFAAVLYGGSPAPAAAPAAAPPAQPAAAVPANRMASLADRLYGSPATPALQPAPTAPGPAPAPAPSPAADTTPAPDTTAPVASPLTAAAIAASIPDSVKAERDADTARRLFNNTADIAEIIDAGTFDGMQPEAAKALASELVEMVRDVGATAADAQIVSAAMQRAHLSPMTDAQRIGAREQVVDALNTRYGVGAKQALNDARQFVAADPRRAAMLAKVGDDPRVVMRIVELAADAKRAGRLTQPSKGNP